MRLSDQRLTATADPRPGNALNAGSREMLWLLLLVILALVVRLPGLTESLWFDELWSTRVKLATAGDMLRSALADVHPPFYAVISFAWIQVFGDSELAVRSLPLLAGLATVGLMPSLGAALGNARAGWLAGVLLALSPVHIWYSQEARAYSLIMLLAVVVVLAWRALDRRPAERSRQVAFILLSAAFVQLHFFAIALPAALAGIALIQRRNRPVALTALALSALGISAVVASKYLSGTFTVEGDYLRTFTLSEARDLLAGWFPLGGAIALNGADETPIARAAGWGFVVLCVVALGAWLAAGWRTVKSSQWLETVAILLAVPALLLTLAVLQRTGYYIERSALPSLPAYFLAVASGVWLIRHVVARRVVIAAAVMLSGIVFSNYHARRDVRTVYKPNPDWRAILEPLARERGTPARPLVVFSTTPVTELVYYIPGATECPRVGSTPTGRPATGARGVIARMFPRSEQLTCGAGGTASVRLYVERDSGSAWINEARMFEADALPVVILNRRWMGMTPALLRGLNGERPLRPIATASGLEVFAFSSP